MKRTQPGAAPGTVIHLHIARVLVDRGVAAAGGLDAAALQAAIAARLGGVEVHTAASLPRTSPFTSAVSNAVADAVATRLAGVGVPKGGRDG
jgi:hypothetical protein